MQDGGMRLDAWLEKKGITLADFGRLIGKSAPTVSRLSRGIGNTNLSTLAEIERATDGEVTAADVLQSRGAAE